MCLWEAPPARDLVHGAHEHGGRAVQLRHDAEVARQAVEALERQHGVRVLHRHRVLDHQDRSGRWDTDISQRIYL